MMKDKRLKVVHILEGFLGGTSTYMCTVLPQLVRNGLDVTLISSLNRSCPDAETRMSQLRASGVKVHIISMHREINPFKDTYSFVVILRLLSRNKFDVVHTHCSKAGALGRVAGFMTGKNVRLHTPHCFAFTRCDNRFKRLLYLFLERAIGGLTTKLVTVSSSQADAAVNSGIVPSYKCATVNNALSNGQSISSTTLPANNSVSKASLGLHEDTQIVSTACRLVDYKGIFRFLRAAELSRAANAMFLIAGDGKLRASAERFIKENRLSDRVRLLGHVSNMESIYAMSDVVTLCSDAEAQPYSLLEAMRARCPIVATSVIGNKELISHDRTGLLVEPQPESIARAIDELLANADKRNKYAENAYAYFCRHHTLEKQISELTEIYNSVT
jgi:glycosyltransferase involved in cell wall biosynthesis